MPDQPNEDIRERLLDAALPNVAFDGWTPATFRAAIRATGIDPVVANGVCPRGGVDLALAYHARGDARMLERLRESELDALRIRERIALAVRLRIEAIDDREAARRASALFALPQHATEGARAIWGTADLIWNALGDDSEDVNWYSKRATLSGVYGSTVLYWLGDTSEGCAATWGFLDRRIEDVMRIEKLKAQVRGNRLLSGALAGPNWLLGRVKAPPRARRPDMGGSWVSPR